MAERHGTGPRSPMGDRPLSRVSLVLVDVSSMKTSRCGMVRVIASRFVTHTSRALATSALPFSHAAALFNLDRTFADVLTVQEVVAYIARLSG
jgi:hypothetical protein